MIIRYNKPEMVMDIIANRVLNVSKKLKALKDDIPLV